MSEPQHLPAVCNWTIDWGDVPTWIGAIGALAAVFWAVFLYANSLRDQRRAQARLLAPVGGVAPVQVLPGTALEAPAVITDDGLIGRGADGHPVIGSEAYKAKVRIVSTSNEAFSDLHVWLILPDGSQVEYPLGHDEVGPHEDQTQSVYFPPDTIYGPMRVRLTFRDANGRRWERINGQPVRELPRSSRTKAQG